jgi:hypothetical protein
MPKHPDFQKIYDAFMWRYCPDHNECDTGKGYYYGWLKNMGLDDTKPYQRPQEKFSWIEPYFKYLKEDELAKYFKVEALFPLTSMNDNVYTADELLRGTRTLIGKTPNWNHTPEMAPEVQVYDADYEGDCAECLLRVLKGSKALREIECGNVVHVSVEIDCLRGSEWTPEGSTCRGLVFTGLALLTKDVLPGVPLTRIMPVEKLVESFTVTDVTKMNEQNNSNPPPQTDPPPQTPPPPGTSPPEPSGQQEAEWTAAYINDLPDSSFAVIEPAYPEKTQDKQCRHLPYKDKDGTVDLDHLRNALARMNQIEPVTDSISAPELRAKAQHVLIAAAKAAGVGDYELYPYLKIQDLQAEMHALQQVVFQGFEDLKKPKDPPKEEPKKEQPCKCVLTKEGFWARFHQLRQEGASKSEAFRLVSLEVIEAASKKA